jgi:hypothetical protein
MLLTYNEALKIARDRNKIFNSFSIFNSYYGYKFRRSLQDSNGSSILMINSKAKRIGDVLGIPIYDSGNFYNHDKKDSKITNKYSCGIQVTYNKTGDKFIAVNHNIFKLPRFIQDFIIMHELGHAIRPMSLEEYNTPEGPAKWELDADLYAAKYIGLDNVINARQVYALSAYLNDSLPGKTYINLLPELYKIRKEKLANGEDIKRKVEISSKFKLIGNGDIKISNYSMTDVNLIDNKLYILMFTKDPNSRISRSVSKVSPNYTHVAFSLSSDLSHIYDMYGTGFRDRDINHLDKSDRNMDIYSIEYNNIGMIRLLIRAINSKDTKYDLSAAINILLARGKYKYNEDQTDMILNNKRFICSSFIASALYLSSDRIREYIDDNKLDVRTIVPDDILKFPGIKYLDSIYLGGK